jgi:hypothetical protein
MSYTLEYTAEQINHRLDLINENKNLLPYKYSTVFPAGLEDVGDGSILISATHIPTLSEDILLNTCSLPAGENKKYTISLNVTDLVTEENLQDHAVQLVVAITDRDPIILDKSTTSMLLDLSSEAEPVTVSVSISKGTPIVTADALIKPQIEVGTTKTDWVPYMDKIGSYVDRRFNGTTAKIKAHVENKNNPHNITPESLGLKPVEWQLTYDNGSSGTVLLYVKEV